MAGEAIGGILGAAGAFAAASTTTSYGFSTRWVWDMGIAMMPSGGALSNSAAVGAIVGLAAGLPAPSAVVQLYNAVCYKVVDWVAEGIGGKPIMPAPNTGSANEIFLYKTIGGASPSTAPDQSVVWTVTGTYIYGLLVPPSDTDMLSLGTNPYTGLNQANVQFSQSSFLGGLLSSGNVGPEFQGFPFNAGPLPAILAGQRQGKPVVNP